MRRATRSRDTRPVRRTRLRSAAALMLIAGLAACDGDSPEPAGPAGSGPAEAALESNELDSGGTGVLVSDGFAGLELEPALDDDGAIIPDRWANLRVSVGGIDTDVRRIDERTIEFSVPILPGGTYGVDVASRFAHGSISARVFGVVASERVVPCYILPRDVALIPVGHALVFDADCSLLGGQHGVGVMWPAVSERGFEWLAEGEASEFWVWEAGRNPRPVEPLDCFGTADGSQDFVAPAEAGDGTCLLIDPLGREILRDGQPVADWPEFTAGHFVMSDDAWVTARNAPRLVVRLAALHRRPPLPRAARGGAGRRAEGARAASGFPAGLPDDPVGLRRARDGRLDLRSLPYRPTVGMTAAATTAARIPP